MAKICGAKTRSGAKCKSLQMANGRCRMHGGTNTGAPKENINAVSHGIYQQYLTDVEREQYDTLELGKVDHELRLTRIRLARALAAEQHTAGQPELDEITENDGAGEYVAKETRKSRVRDYVKIIDSLTARIESLEKTRRALVEEGDGNGDEVVGFEVFAYEADPAV